MGVDFQYKCKTIGLEIAIFRIAGSFRKLSKEEEISLRNLDLILQINVGMGVERMRKKTTVQKVILFKYKNCTV